MKTLETMKKQASDALDYPNMTSLAYKKGHLTGFSEGFDSGAEAQLKALSEIGIDGAHCRYLTQDDSDEEVCYVEELPVVAQILQLKQENEKLQLKNIWLKEQRDLYIHGVIGCGKITEEDAKNSISENDKFLENAGETGQHPKDQKIEQIEAENLRLREVLKEAHVAFEKIDRFGYGANFEKNLVITNTLDLALSVCNKIREALSGKGEV